MRITQDDSSAAGSAVTVNRAEGETHQGQIGMDKLAKEQSIRFGVGRITRDGHPFAGFDGIGGPSDVG